MSSQQLRTGVEGATAIVHQPRVRYGTARARIRAGGDYPCCCEQCRATGQTWPRHMVGIPPRADRDAESPDLWLAWECWHGRHPCDPELADQLNQLRNEPRRAGAAWAEGRRLKPAA